MDLIITDPPYESLEKHRSKGTTTRLKYSMASSNPWFETIPNNRLEPLLSQLFRVLKPNSHSYVFCDQETMFLVKPLAEKVGFRFWKPIIWDKKRIGMGYHYRSRYECILFLEKGKRKLNNLSVPDILESPRIVGGYPTEKPVDLAEILVLQSSFEHQLIIDPFMGSGFAGVAAIRNKRSFAGNDISDKAISLAKSRLTEAMNIEKYKGRHSDIV